MRLTSVYVLRQWWRSFFLVLLIVLATFSILTLSETLGDHGVSVGQGFLITGLQIPLFLLQLMPGCCLIGSVVCLALLDRSSELTILRNIGMGYPGILHVIWLGGVLPLAIVMVFNNEWLAPRTQVFIADLRHDGGDAHTPFFLDRDNLWLAWHDTHINVRRVHADGHLRDAIFFQYDETADPIPSLRVITEARDGRPGHDGVWLLSDTRQTRITTDRFGPRTREMPYRRWPLPHPPDALTQARVPIAALPWSSLVNRALYGWNRPMQLIHTTTLGSRLLQPVLLVLMAALAIPLVKMVRGTGTRIISAALVTVVWHTVNQLIHYAGVTQSWPAWLIISMPPAALTVIVLIGMRKP